MGFFSWHTTDTNRPIMNRYSGKNFPVYMIAPFGAQWYEDNYEGYGVFGGKDYYELLAEMNLLDWKLGFGSAREAGITLAHSKDPKGMMEKVGQIYVTPNFVEEPNQEWINVEPISHVGQGHWT